MTERRGGPAGSVTTMTERAAALAELLGDGGRFPFDDPARRSWTYLPGERPGIPLAAMDRATAGAAFALLATGLGSHAYAQAAAIMALEDVLDLREQGARDRHRGDYWCAVYGEPGAAGAPWGWSVGGHHVSVHWTVTPDGHRATPLFLGANPARTTAPDGRTVVAPLSPEEDTALALLAALDVDQRARAVLPRSVPADILTRDAATLTDLPATEGVPLADLGGRTAEVAGALVDVYRRRAPAAHVGGAEDARFVWIGGTGPGEPRYYRIQGPHLLVEFDNTQDGANHIHSVVRDPDGDFGADLLRSHRRDARVAEHT